MGICLPVMVPFLPPVFLVSPLWGWRCGPSHRKCEQFSSWSGNQWWLAHVGLQITCYQSGFILQKVHETIINAIEFCSLYFFYHTCPVSQSKLSAVISTPAKHTSRRRKGKALFSPCSNLNKWDQGHRPKVLGFTWALSHTKLASGVLAPCIHLTSCGETTMTSGWELYCFGLSLR